MDAPLFNCLIACFEGVARVSSSRESALPPTAVISTPDQYAAATSRAPTTAGIASNVAKMEDAPGIPNDNVLKKACRVLGKLLSAAGISIGVLGGVAAIGVGVVLTCYSGSATAGIIVIILGVCLNGIPSIIVGKIGVGLMYLGDEKKRDRKDFDAWDSRTSILAFWPFTIWDKRNRAALYRDNELQPIPNAAPGSEQSPKTKKEVEADARPPEYNPNASPIPPAQAIVSPHPNAPPPYSEPEH